MFTLVGGWVLDIPDPSPAFGLLLGAVFGFAVGLATASSRAWGAFTVVRTWLALTGRTPPDLMRFLRDAHARGVLRQAGAVHQFRHARLQDRLAEVSEP